MSVVTLPLPPRLAKISPRLLRFGGDLTSALGGPSQRISRLGSRFAVRVDLPAMDLDCGRQWIAARTKAEAEGSTARLVLAQADAAGVVGVTASAGGAGASLPVSSVAGISVGLFFSFVVSGHAYLHQVTGIAGGTLAIAPLLRVTPAAGNALEFAAPVVEGLLDDVAWDLDLMRFIGQSFTLTEDR